MPDEKISALSDGTTPENADDFVVARSGVNFKLTWAALKAAVSNGGSTPSLVALYEPEASGTIAPSATGFFPTDIWTTLCDDVGALGEFGDTVTLPDGFWLCGGMMDTSNTWPADAEGSVSIGVGGGGGVAQNLLLLSTVPNYGSTYPANGISQALYAPPVLLYSHGPTYNTLFLQAHNNSDQTITVSGSALWAWKLRDLPS